MQVFLSYSAEPRIAMLAEEVAKHLVSLDVRVCDGRRKKGHTALGSDIKNNINLCHAVVTLRLDNPSMVYVLKESDFVQKCRLPIIAITEGSNIPSDVSGYEHLHVISITPGLLAAATGINHAINQIKQDRGLSLLPTLMQMDSEDAVKAEGWSEEELKQRKKIAALMKKRQFDQALDVSHQVYQQYPGFWRAGIGMSSSLIQLRRFDEAREVLMQMLSDHQQDIRACSYTYQNLGWLNNELCEYNGLHTPALIEERIDYYRKSLSAVPRVVVYFNLMRNLIRLNRAEDAVNVLQKCLENSPGAKQDLRNQIELQGREVKEEVVRFPDLYALIYDK